MSSRVRIQSSESESEGSLRSESSGGPENILLEEPMYYVLGQFLENEDGENIAEILTKLVKEVSLLRKVLEKGKESA